MEKDASVTDSMRAAVFCGSSSVEISDVEVRPPGPGEVLIRIRGCGVCGSNLPMWEGREWFDYPRPPGEPGHEGWGRIAAVGDGVEGLQEGDRVTALSYRAFAEYDTAGADAVVRIPSSLGDEPFPGEPLACALNIIRRSGIEEGQTVAVVGVGFLGALLIGLAVDAGARVIGLSRRPTALDFARRYGAEEVVAMEDHQQVIDRVQDLTDGNFCDRVLEATGKQWPLDLAAELTRERGRLIIAGYHQDGLRKVNMQLWNWRGLDVINAHERDQDVYVRGMQEAVEAVADGRLDPSPLYTHRFGLHELDRAMNTLQERPEGFMKAIVVN